MVTTQSTDRNARNSERGFTLIETLIAIIVVIFGLIAITNLFLVATTSNTSANFSTAATTQATEVMERLKAIPFDQLVEGGIPDDGKGSGPNEGTISDCDDDDPANDCVVPGNFNATRTVPGVGQIRTTWQIVFSNPTAYFILVESRGLNTFFKGRTKAQFTTFRALTF
jgi:type II secretory pathway pseudopilin PulG